MSVRVPAVIADATPPIIIGTDWPAIIAAVTAALTTLVTLWYAKKARDRQEATDEALRLIRGRAEIAAQHAANASQYALRAEQSVKESREERTVQIDQVKEEVGSLRSEVREGIAVSNNYNGKIADSASATQAIAEEVRQMRAESQQPKV